MNTYYEYDPAKAEPRIEIASFGIPAVANFALESMKDSLQPDDRCYLEPMQDGSQMLCVYWKHYPPTREMVVIWKAFFYGLRKGYQFAMREQGKAVGA